MQQNSSQWLRRMREKHRRIFGKREREVQVQVQQDGVRADQVQQDGVHEIKSSRHVRYSNNVLHLKERKSASRNPPLASIAELEADVWELRKQFILQIAKRRNGKVRLHDVAAECNVNIRIAAEWLIRLSMEGMLSLIAGQRYTMTYLVKDAEGAQK